MPYVCPHVVCSVLLEKCIEKRFIVTRAEVESALDAMEHANKVMYREGIVHLM